ncbi:MAG: PEGA domain-containing protein [Patescibacteria group bacterium]
MGKLKIAVIITLLLVILVALVFFAMSYLKPQKSGISVESTPLSIVYIDGVSVGRTPYSADLKPGEVVLKLIPDTQNPFLNYETKLSLYPGIKTIVRRSFGETNADSFGEVISFEKTTEDGASLSIVSVPDATQIMLDGQVKGFTPLKISEVLPGDHQLIISAPNYKERSFSIRAVDGYKLTVVAKLAESQEVVVASPSAVLAEEKSIEEVLILDTPTGYLRIRKEPNSASMEVGRATPGLKYELLSTDETTGWFNISFDEKKTGWISNKYAKIVTLDGDPGI